METDYLPKIAISRNPSRKEQPPEILGFLGFHPADVIHHHHGKPFFMLFLVVVLLGLSTDRKSIKPDVLPIVHGPLKAPFWLAVGLLRLCPLLSSATVSQRPMLPLAFRMCSSDWTTKLLMKTLNVLPKHLLDRTRFQIFLRHQAHFMLYGVVKPNEQSMLEICECSTFMFGEARVDIVIYTWFANQEPVPTGLWLPPSIWFRNWSCSIEVWIL